MTQATQTSAVCVAMMLLVAALCTGCGSGTRQDGTTVVSIKGSQWMINGEPVLKGSPAEGLLLNVRMVNAVFEDTGPAAAANLPPDFDPTRNTAEFIEKIPDYCAHGVRGFTVSLQGGMPGYEGAVNTAFNGDGSLRDEYLERVEKLVRAADRSGAIVILSCFYQRQHSHSQALNGKEAIENAVSNIARWIAEKKFSNVVLEISNEFAHGGYRKWKDGEWLRSVDGQVALMQLARAVAPGLLVSTSGMGSGTVPPDIARAADFIVIHFNRTPVELIPTKVAEARAYGKPVICNEDDKLGLVGAEAARVSVKSGAGWGFMHIKKNQSAPFEFDGAADDTTVYAMLKRLSTPGASINTISAEQRFVLITNPVDGDVFRHGKTIAIRAVMTGVDTLEGLKVHFLADDRELGSVDGPPWEIRLDNLEAGRYNVVAVVNDAQGSELMRSGQADFEVKEE